MIASVTTCRMDGIDDLNPRRFIGCGLSLATLLAAAEFTRKPLVVAGSEPGSTFIRTEKDPQNSLFHDLGFTQPAEFTQLIDDEVAREGQDLFLTDEVLDGTLRFESTLSRPCALGRSDHAGGCPRRRPGHQAHLMIAAFARASAMLCTALALDSEVAAAPTPTRSSSPSPRATRLPSGTSS